MTVYTYVWEFIVAPERADDFEHHYGGHGPWVDLFRQAPGYLQTLLLRDATDPRRYFTIDRWESAEAHRKFRAAFSRQYADLDSRCEVLAMRETLIGEFNEPAV